LNRQDDPISGKQGGNSKEENHECECDAHECSQSVAGRTLATQQVAVGIAATQYRIENQQRDYRDATGD
jgi:hypothetical protein